MGSRFASILLGVLLLAGCANDAPPAHAPSSSGQVGPPAPPPMYGPADCDNLLLFQVVDYAQTDPFLPPGFHPRDPQEFLQSPAAFGQAGVIFLALDCDSPSSGPLQAAFVGIFIEAPIVEGIEPAPLNFLELVRYNPSDEFGGALAMAGWPAVEANVSLVSKVPGLHGYDTQAVVADGEGDLAMVAGTAVMPSGGLGGGPTRFWHQGADGLAYIEYSAALAAKVGSGLCQARAGTPLSHFVGAPVGDPDTPVGDLAFSCLGVNGGEPVIVVLDDLGLNATFQWFPGARAG
ncbi:MAG TPA: hypothetical protein VM327_00500 [Candidatus Thermoplasmatota archaeon]|nr:hypothetical protein [Candidatus Thermoplasmatota archaeon]